MSEMFFDCGHFYFRELRESDLEGNWYQWLNDEVVTKFQNKKIFPNNYNKQKDYLNYLANSKNDIVFALVEKETKKHIGNVGLHKIDWVHRSAELGIVLGETSSWGKGIGKAAWKQLTKYAFNQLNLNRVFAIIMEGNVASQKCCEAAGFKQEGRIREYFYKDGRYLDVFYYNITKSDFLSINGTH